MNGYPCALAESQSGSLVIPLPAGLREKNYTINLYVQIFDSENSIATYIIGNLTVEISPSTIQSLVSELLSGVLVSQIALELENTANLQMSSSIMTSLLSTLANLDNQTEFIVLLFLSD